MTATLSRAVASVAIPSLAVLLAGCGDSPSPGPSPTPGPGPAPKPDRPAGPTDCTDELTRGHCTSCYYTGGTDGDTVCKSCSGHYELEGTKTCAVNCTKLAKPGARPTMPKNPMEHNGVRWPDACFDDTEDIHFFTLGDWGGVCSWVNGNICDQNSNPFGEPKKPFPMDNRHGAPLHKPVDFIAQRLVADRMREKAIELRKQNQAPKFVINVGDNFYPGGVDKHCGAGTAESAFAVTQFAQVFEAMYPVEDVGDVEWWSVLGNHDYGGVCYVKAWDQQIYYTWKPDGRWIMPGQYWQRHVQFKTFDADFFFLDTNILDAWPASVDPNHNICSNQHNPGKYCETAKYPPLPGSDARACPVTGPANADECLSWFRTMWKTQYKWFVDAVKKSTADWQIVVTHHPANYNPGKAEDGSFLNWKNFVSENGIDLIISGHKHQQEVYYHTAKGGADLGDTAWVITGGGGGVTSELLPTDSGNDDAYGFMSMKLNLKELEITAISHGGAGGNYIERSKTTVPPVIKKSTVAAEEQVVV